MKQRNFTLIALLAVIAAGVTLAAILFPVFAQAREKARAQGCNGASLVNGRAANVRLPGLLPGPGGRATVLPNGWQVTPAGRHIPLAGDMPLTMLLTPDGKSLLVNTAGYHDHSVTVINVATETVTQSVNVGSDWLGMCLNPQGNALYVSGGGSADARFAKDAAGPGASADQIKAFQTPVMRLSLSGGSLAPEAGLAIPGLDGKERFVSGLASGADGSLYVVNLGEDTVYKWGGSPEAVEATAKVGRRPYAVAVSPDGRTVAVTNWADASVSMLASNTLQEQERVLVGSHPNALAWSRDGRLFVANAGSNSVSVLAGGRVTETIKTSLDPKAPVGSTPDALAVSPDGRRLFVANADNNDVAVVDVSNPSESRVIGFLPTGWYPSALAVSADGRKLFIGTGKGLTFQPSATPDTHVTSPQTLSDYSPIGSLLSGAISVVDLPSAARLAAYTRQVRANTPSPKTAVVSDPAAIRRKVFPKIKHVVYIIRENRTYDNVFGDIDKGNGDARLTLFGKNVTPNAHALADKYVLLDNLYCNAEVSEDGHPWSDAAYATDYTEHVWPLHYGGRREPKGDDELTESPAGFLWDNCRRHGVSFYSYGERAQFKSGPNSPPVFTGDRGLAGHASAEYGKFGWFAEPRDIGRATIFINDLHAAEKSGKWPQFMVMSLPEDHTQGQTAKALTPTANVGENDQGLGKIVEAVSHSKFWASTAIFVIEDDAQGGPDHVDAHRTVGLVISPYIRRGAVDSTMYSTASFIHTMELILGLPPMTQYDAAAVPLYNAFTPQPNLLAYYNLEPRVDLEARNPSKGAGATASAKLDFSAPDRADPDALNAILWHALKPDIPQPAPVRSAQLPH